jgi:hypothetical protein
VCTVYGRSGKRGEGKRRTEEKKMDECHFIMTNVSILEENKLFLHFSNN